jgi:hypothetical protein
VRKTLRRWIAAAAWDFDECVVQRSEPASEARFVKAFDEARIAEAIESTSVVTRSFDDHLFT